MSNLPVYLLTIPSPDHSAKETGGGVTLDIALYPTQLTCLVMGGEMPEKILATGHLNENVSQREREGTGKGGDKGPGSDPIR